MTDHPDRPRLATAEMLAIGAELLAGETRDTNSGELARELTALGVEVSRMSQLPDELGAVSSAVEAALGRADLVVTSGGLGPTPDDLTRESIAAALGLEPFVDPALEAWLRQLWAGRGLPFSEVNLKQAWLIPGATALDNPNGTAPGWWVEHAQKVIVALPGPPRELRPMWRDQVLPRLHARGLGLDRAVHTLHLAGIGESALVDLVGKELLEHGNPRMATYARADFVDLRVSAVADGAHDAESLVAAAIDALSPRLDPYAFARDDEDWTSVIASTLGPRALAVLEVGTGGYTGLLLGACPCLVHAEQRRTAPDDPAVLARAVRELAEADVGLAVIAADQGDDMHVKVGLSTISDGWVSEGTVFRGGDTGRRRAANQAIAELWRRLA